MQIALIDLKESTRGCRNKDVAGTFGNAMQGDGLAAKIFERAKRSQLRMPLMHFGYLNAILKRAGHRTEFCDSFPQTRPDVALLASSLVGTGEELAFARELKARTGASVGFIGAMATVQPDLFLEGGADFVIKGEPEAAVLTHSANGGFQRGVIESPLLTDLEKLPFPDWSEFPVRSFRYAPALKRRPVLPIQTSRGCSFDCSYCPYMVTQTEKFRARGVGHAVDEIEHLQKTYGVRSVLFRDIIFTQNKKRAREIAEEILRRGLKIEFSIETRSDCLTEELLELLARAGLRSLQLGIESPVMDIQKRSGRIPIAEERQERIVRAAEKLGVRVAGFFILGFVQDTLETMQRTINYAKFLNPFLAQFDIMTPYPGTRFFKEIEPRLLTRDWTRYTTYHPVVKLDHISSEDVLRFKDKAYREFYFRPAWWMKNGWKLVA